MNETSTVPIKCIGIIGGISPQSTITYYETIIRLHHESTGRHDYPRIVIGSIPFELISDASHKGHWDEVLRLVQAEGNALAGAGADFILISANTIHKVLSGLRLGIPVLTVYEAVKTAARTEGFQKLGLTGTRFTMSEDFYRLGLEEKGLEVVLPTKGDQDVIHRIIYEELVSGEVVPESREAFSGIAGRLVEAGADAVLLACTELELLTREIPLEVPCLDTTFIHASAAWELATGRAEYLLTETGGSG